MWTRQNAAKMVIAITYGSSLSIFSSKYHHVGNVDRTISRVAQVIFAMQYIYCFRVRLLSARLAPVQQ
jgi:hypothetical protein